MGHHIWWFWRPGYLPSPPTYFIVLWKFTFPAIDDNKVGTLKQHGTLWQVSREMTRRSKSPNLTTCNFILWVYVWLYWVYAQHRWIQTQIQACTVCISPEHLLKDWQAEKALNRVHICTLLCSTAQKKKTCFVKVHRENADIKVRIFCSVYSYSLTSSFFSQQSEGTKGLGKIN
jgi:uncharacterized membrane protein (DUF106 family)